MTHEPHLSPWAVIGAQVGAALASSAALPHLPTWLVSACAALVVGVLLRVLDPMLRMIGDRNARRFADPPTAPLARVVLVVDDHHADRSLLAHALRTALDVEVIEASNGAEARVLFASRRPRVVIADLILHDELGDNVLAALPRRVRTVLTSGVADTAALTAAADGCGAVAMHKPVDSAAITALVRGWLAP